MYRHLLITVDGSPLSDSVFQRSIVFAKEMNAAVTVLRAIPEDHLLVYQAEMLGTAQGYHTDQARKNAQAYLDGLEAQARSALVPCSCLVAVNDHPHAAIVDTAKAQGCDLIIMGSHGRHGMTGFLLGSETQRVLAQTAAGAGAALVCSPANTAAGMRTPPRRRRARARRAGASLPAPAPGRNPRCRPARPTSPARCRAGCAAAAA